MEKAFVFQPIRWKLYERSPDRSVGMDKKAPMMLHMNFIQYFDALSRDCFCQV
jgi:hypothetical protein